MAESKIFINTDNLLQTALDLEKSNETLDNYFNSMLSSVNRAWGSWSGTGKNAASAALRNSVGTARSNRTNTLTGLVSFLRTVAASSYQETESHVSSAAAQFK